MQFDAGSCLMAPARSGRIRGASAAMRGSHGTCAERIERPEQAARHARGVTWTATAPGHPYRPRNQPVRALRITRRVFVARPGPLCNGPASAETCQRGGKFR
ncbi:hypothetical protein B0G84_2991 [Paraburkholderia sp. BL8N3]|jgi:hypothetical protein|nr:hypothetical protein B0G84_2991 [Paraburkholderia sp. BL8N3]